MTVSPALLALASVSLTAASAVAGDVALKWNFREGRQHHYVLTTELETSMKPEGLRARQKLSQVCHLTWAVKKVKPDGSAEMTHTFDRMQIEVQIHGFYNDKVDSKEKADAAQSHFMTLIHERLDRIVGTPIDVVMSSRGDLLSMTVPSKLSEISMPAVPELQYWNSVLSGTGLKVLINQSCMLLLPRNAIPPGGAWRRTEFGADRGFGRVNFDVTYTDRGQMPGKPDIRQIDGAVRIQFPMPVESNLRRRVIWEDNRSRSFFNTRAGQLSRAETRCELRIDCSLKGHEWGVEELTQAVTLALAEQAPK